MLTRPYLRASTQEQDASRAKAALQDFITENGLQVATWYQENESGTRINRPELSRLLAESNPGDILLIEQVDRLARLEKKDWDQLKDVIAAKRLKIIALDLPTSHRLAKAADPASSDDYTSWALEAINSLLLDLLAATARKDYLDRRRRQKEGIEKAQAEGRFRGRPEDADLLARIEVLLRRELSWTEIQKTLAKGEKTVSRATIAKVARRMREAEEKASAA
jgi:DNA invertase Pin-like site-specific DNA recombinase